MSRVLAGLFATVLILTGVVAVSGPARAETRIVSATIENRFPRDLIFRLTAEADTDISDVTLRYALVGRNTSALGKPDEELTPSPNVGVSVTVEVNSRDSYIPVGSEFRYHWEVTTADGEVTSTPEESFVFLPPDKEWEQVEDDVMRVYYHGDRRELAEQYLQAGEATYERVARELFQTELEQVPVKVVLFAQESELEQARPGRGGTFDSAVITCGTKVTSDIVLVIPASCGTPEETDTLRHEFGHIINEAAGEGPLGKLPSWLDEGTAVYAQSTPGRGYTGAFEAAVQSGQLMPFDQMGTPTNNPNAVNLFYGQSYAMVQFLIDESPEQFRELFATIKAGSRFDTALEQVYGWDLDEFEDVFRDAYGLGPRVEPTPAPTEQPREAEPTPAPTRRPIVTTQSSDDNIDRFAIGIIALAVLFGLLAVFAYLASQFLSSSRGAPASGPPEQPERPEERWRRPPDDGDEG